MRIQKKNPLAINIKSNLGIEIKFKFCDGLLYHDGLLYLMALFDSKLCRPNMRL